MYQKIDNSLLLCIIFIKFMFKTLSLILILLIYSPVRASQPSEEQLVSKFEHIIAPPKNINDVIRLLDSSKPDLEKVKKLFGDLTKLYYLYINF